MVEADIEAAGVTSGSEAAAILLMLLEEAEAAEVLTRLSPEEVQQVGSAMFELSDVSESQVDSVVVQFMTMAKARTTLGFDASKKVRAVMTHALGPARADSMLARITPPTSSRALDALHWMDARTIAMLVKDEHPQIAALVLAHLEPTAAGDVLQLLPAEIQPDVIHRVATLEVVTAEALEELERILVGEVSRSATPATARGGAGEAAKIMNNLRPGTGQRIIRSLNKVDKRLAQTIEEEMFVFDDLIGVDEKSLSTLFRNVENDALVLALKGATPRLREKILGCMSSRAAEAIKDEMEERGPVRLAEVQDAQREVLAIARRLADAGTIMLLDRGNDYV